MGEGAEVIGRVIGLNKGLEGYKGMRLGILFFFTAKGSSLKK